MARKYTKKDTSYWETKSKAMGQSQNLNELMTSDYLPVSAGEAFYSRDSAKASRYDFNNSTNQSKGRINNKFRSTNSKSFRYDNIANGLSPFDMAIGTNYITASETIELCQKAYYNVSIFRNTIDMMAEFSNSDIEVKKGTVKSREFVEKWLESINVWALKGQFFREYYRSGNVFLLRFDGRFTNEQSQKLKNSVGAIDLKNIPLKYVLLNPSQIALQAGSTFGGEEYLKMLSKYEIQALKTQATEQDKEIFKALPKEVQDQIKSGGFTKGGLRIKLDPSRLHYSFYKKQDYEPFAVPFGFPVLDDINWKLEMKRQDAAVSRTIENAILLITMGNKDTGEVNKRAMEAMQTLFLNESVGRVLVADATVNAQFIIPDLSEVINPDKYKIVNSDIKEGLQNIFASDSSGEKFSNMQIKMKVFFTRLQEGRKAFERDFLKPEIKRVCKEAGFKAPYPTINFDQIDLNDHQQLMRVYSRLMELGILTPEEGLRAMETGVLPEAEDSLESQREFRKLRDEGLYEPIIGGGTGANAGRPQGTTGIPQTTQNVSPIGTKSSASKFSVTAIAQTMNSIHDFTEFVQKAFKNKYACKNLTKKMKDLASEFALTIASRYETKEWEDKAQEYFDNMNLVLTDNITEVSAEVDDIAAKFEIPSPSASILFHSQKISVIPDKAN